MSVTMMEPAIPSRMPSRTATGCSSESFGTTVAGGTPTAS